MDAFCRVSGPKRMGGVVLSFFADQPPPSGFWAEAWKYVVGGGGAAGLIAAARYAYVHIYKTRAEVAKDDRVSTVKEWRDYAKHRDHKFKELEEDMRDLREESKTEIDRCHKEREDAQRQNARMLERLDRYEEALKEADIPFRPFVLERPGPPPAEGVT